MWRYVAGGVGGLAVIAAGVVMLTGREAAPAAALPPPPARTAQEAGDAPPAELAEATPRTREQKRFGRYDKDRNGAISREEYLISRRKAYAKLDTDGDGRLSFDEWAAKTSAKFAAADRDRSGTMTATEFATTAVKRKPARAAKCPPVRRPEQDEG